MNRNAKIVVVVPVGPKDGVPYFTAPEADREFTFRKIVSVLNGRVPRSGEPRPTIWQGNALGITESHRQGVNKALELEPDIIALCYSAAYRKHLNGILDYHLGLGKPVTITARRNPRWEKWTGRVGSRVIHYAARWLLGLPFIDNCSGLYVFTAARHLILKRIKPWIVVSLPPLATQRAIVRLRFLPPGS